MMTNYKYVKLGEILCPIIHHTLNGDLNEVHAIVIINEAGRTERITLPLDVFNALEEIEIEEEKGS